MTVRATGAEVDLDLVVLDKKHLAESVVTLVLGSRDGAPLPSWEPGAHVDLRLGGDLVRQYSLCGDPQDGTHWRVAVLREPSGRGGSMHVHDVVEVGDTVAVRGPRNHFPLVDAPRYLFIAGGIGITPLLPMLGEAERRGRDWRLVYGGRTRAGMAFAQDLVKAHPDSVSLCPQDETGLLDLEAVLGQVQDDVDVYCCGPEPLLAAVEERCAAWPEGALHVERFSAKPGALDAPANAFELELRQSGKRLSVPADRSIVDVLADVGVVVPTSCREGTCGTCETTVLAGEVDHRDSLLSDAERAASETMMLCVSRCTRGPLVLDL